MLLKTTLVVVGTLSALLVAPPAHAAPLFLVDGGLVLGGRTSVNAGRAELQPLLGLRGGALFPLSSDDDRLLLGVDGRLLIETLPRVRGTADVGSLTWELGLQPRGLVGWRFGDGPLQLLPYAFAGALVGGRLVSVHAFGAQQLRGHATYGAAAGAGGLLRIGVVSLALELGAGLREDGPEVTGALLAGASF